jgi:hypothetical protein
VIDCEYARRSARVDPYIENTIRLHVATVFSVYLH